MRVRPLLRTLRAGDARGRLVALRSSRVALDVAITGAAVRTGLLQELGDPVDVSTLAARHRWRDPSLVEAALQSFAAHGLVEEQDGRWRVARRGRRVLDDEVMRAAYEAFSGYHTELYRELDRSLTAGGDRRDIADHGDLIARLSHFMDEFVCAELDRVTADHQPHRLLDVGCGAGAHLRHVLRANPATTAVGVEADADAAAMARAALAADRLDLRAEIVEADVATFLRDSPDAVFDLVLLANAIYYVPPPDRVAFLRALADRLEPGGRLVVVSTALGQDPFSRHFDLLLRAQADSAMELPDVGQLTAQLTSAGLVPGIPRRIAPGEPLTAVTATRP